MATIRKRGSKFHVQIRKNGHSTITKTFTRKVDGETWAKQIESEIERGVFLDATPAQKITLTEALNRYEDEILPAKKGADQDRCRIKRIRDDLGFLPLNKIMPQTVARYRDKRLLQVKPATVKKEIGMLSRVLTAAEKEFGIHLPHGNPVRRVRVPVEPPGRDRRLENYEFDQLMVALKGNHLIQQIVRFATATGMRRGEICRIRKQDINWDKKTLHIPVTKNDRPRTIPLSAMASESLCELLRLSDSAGMESPIIPLKDPHSITRAFSRACQRAGITDLRFHDLRHEAISRFFEKGLNVMEVASITGHQDLRMLRRYTHIRAETLVDRL